MRTAEHLNHRGMTLVELLISMAVGLIVLGALVGTFIIQEQAYKTQEQITEMVQSARAAMDMIAREIQMAGYDPTGATFDAIPYNSSQLQIRADHNGDGDTGDTNEDVIYTYDGTSLRINRNAQPFAENIQSFAFTYQDGSGSATTTTADIRQIQINITARTGKPDPNYGLNGGYRTYLLKSLVTPKNLNL